MGVSGLWVNGEFVGTVASQELVAMDCAIQWGDNLKRHH
jgi:hypothetical protein